MRVRLMLGSALLVEHLKINRKFVVVTSLGLILSVMSIASVSMFVDGQSSVIIQDQLSWADSHMKLTLPNGQMSVGVVDDADARVEDFLDEYRVDFQIDHRIAMKEAHLRYERIAGEQYEDYGATLLLLDPDSFDEVLRALDQNPDDFGVHETLFVFPTASWVEKPSFYGNSSVVLHDQYGGTSYTILIGNSISPSFSWDSPTADELDEIGVDTWLFTDGEGCLVGRGEYLDRNWMDASSMYLKYWFDLGGKDYDTLVEAADRLLDGLNNEEWDDFPGSGNSDVWADSYLLWALYDARSTITMMKAVLTFLSAPVIIVAMFIAGYAYNLVKPWKRSMIGIYKTRGAEEKDVRSAILAEKTASTLLSLVLGMIIALPLAWLLLKSSWFLEFKGDGDMPRLTQSTFNFVLIAAVIVSVLINFGEVRNAPRMSILEAHNPVVKRKPRWQRLHFDILFTSLGAFGWIAFRVMLEKSSDWTYGESGLIILLLTLAVFLGAFSWIFVSIGGTLLIAHYFPLILNKVSHAAWRRRRNMGTLALRNLHQRSASVTRTVVLISFAMMFVTFGSALPDALLTNEVQRAYYNTGADMNVAGDVNVTTRDSILALDNVESVSQVHTGSFDIDTRDVTGGISGNYYFHFFVFDEKTADTLFWRDCYGGDLHDFIDELQVPGSFAVHSREAFGADWNVGDDVDIAPAGASLEQKMVGTFDYFPMLIDHVPGEYNEMPYYAELHVVMSADTLDALSDDPLVGSVSAEAKTLISLNDNDEWRNTRDEIRKLISVDQTINCAETAVENSKESSIKVIMGAFNADYILGIASIGLVIVLFGFSVLSERMKEIGVYKSLGMNRGQLLKLLSSENLIVMLFSLILGAALGMVVSLMGLSLLVISDSTVPPIMYTFPMKPVLLTFVITTVVSLIGAIIPASIASKRETARVLRSA